MEGIEDLTRAPVGRMTGPAGRRSARAAALILLVACALLGSSCAANGGGDEPTARTVTLRVFAAASLTDVMDELEQIVEEANPTIDVVVDLAGSSALRTQILEGAPADVVATANPQVMDDLATAGVLAGPAQPFATNRLVIAVAPGNPGAIGELADLADPELFVGLCAAGVPCGDLADEALVAAGLEIEVDSREPDVRSVLTKIRAGELDAGLVYATDVAAAAGDGVEGIALPDGLPVVTTYPVAILADTPHPEAAAAFVAVLTGERGRVVLSEHGFDIP